MKELFDDLEAEHEDLLRDRDLRGQLARIQDELELFSHTSWGMFIERLESLVRKDMDALVNCPMEEVAPTRARIKAHRSLLGLETSLRGRESDLRAALAAPEENDDE